MRQLRAQLGEAQRGRVGDELNERNGIQVRLARHLPELLFAQVRVLVRRLHRFAGRQFRAQRRVPCHRAVELGRDVGHRLGPLRVSAAPSSGRPARRASVLGAAACVPPTSRASRRPIPPSRTTPPPQASNGARPPRRRAGRRVTRHGFVPQRQHHGSPHAADAALPPALLKPMGARRGWTRGGRGCE